MRLHFGHCIGCDQPIRPPYRSFKLMESTGDGSAVTEFGEVDICSPCERLTFDELRRLVIEGRR